MSNILVFGASGHLGTCIKTVATRRGVMDISFPGEDVNLSRNEGVTSWFDFAKGFFEISNTKVNAYPIATAEYPNKSGTPCFLRHE